MVRYGREKKLLFLDSNTLMSLVMATNPNVSNPAIYECSSGRAVKEKVDGYFSITLFEAC